MYATTGADFGPTASTACVFTGRHDLALGGRCKRERSYEGEEYGRQPDSC